MSLKAVSKYVQNIKKISRIYKLLRAIFISHPISALDPDSSRADIQRLQANKGCDMKIAM